MAATEPLQVLAASVQALFTQQCGTFRAADFIAVAELLGFIAYPHLPLAASPLPIASNHVADLIGVNLQHALTTYAWDDWRPLSDDGVTVAGIWHAAQSGEAPAGYLLTEDGRTWQRS